MTDLQPAPPETEQTSLHHGRLGIIGIVFFVVAAAAPLVGMTGAVPVAVVVGNGARNGSTNRGNGAHCRDRDSLPPQASDDHRNTVPAIPA